MQRAYLLLGSRTWGARHVMHGIMRDIPNRSKIFVIFAVIRLIRLRALKAVSDNSQCSPNEIESAPAEVRLNNLNGFYILS
jgi:hypothetical protein